MILYSQYMGNSVTIRVNLALNEHYSGCTSSTCTNEVLLERGPRHVYDSTNYTKKYSIFLS